MLRTIDLIRNLHSNFPTATPRPFDRHGAGPDVMIMLLTAAAYPKVMCISDSLVFFRVHSGSFTISNNNNEVSAGYTSAISYHLMGSGKWLSWICYLTGAWLHEVKNRKHWINPIKYLESNEGNGSILELLFLVLIAPLLSAKKIFRRA